MLENDIRHATICEEVNRAYKQGAGKEFHETFHGFRDRNDARKMSRSLLGLNLDMFKKMSRIRDFKAARGALVALANQAMMIIIELDSKPIEKDNHGALCKELQELYHLSLIHIYITVVGLGSRLRVTDCRFGPAASQQRKNHGGEEAPSN